MNSTSAYASEAIIGPPSNPIHVQYFINQCSHSQSLRGPGESCYLNTTWHELSEEQKREVEEECGVGDLEATLNETLSNPFLYSHLFQSLENNIEAIRANLKPSGQPKPKPRKRKRTEKQAPDETQLSPEVLQLRNNLNDIPLKCWPYPVDAANFTRPQKNSDLNILTKPKGPRTAGPSTLPQSSRSPDAILIVSVYNRLSWGNHLSCSSQHAVLASQTIGDLYEVIPCPSNEIPPEKRHNGKTIGYEDDEPPPHSGCVVCIEGIAYGDGQSEEDYSDKLIKQFELIPEKKRPRISKGVGMHDQPFSKLTLRLNQPYWLLHQGACEHFLVVDHLRMLQASDLQDGYPLTLQIAPPILDLCMACARVPAVLSVVGDVRLGQSPFKICQPCWTLFGEPRSEDRAILIPLPKYELGW
ncbi:snRNA-activating protein of 50kDa MW C terminal-domain-containing protein [Phellopilus nigrolimitatus]|nr:snRNA-activating protein of 50kDa MW C terminal-domain-containing protein [Phellopilus nigrolimitatus]